MIFRIFFLSACAVLLMGCSRTEEYGLLHITSHPGDVQVFINGERRGNTPEVESRSFTIRLKQGVYRVEGYRPINTDMEYYGLRESLHVGGDTEQHLVLRMEKRLTEKGMANAAVLYMEKAFTDRYADNGDGTLTDRETGLQWMRCSLGQQWDGESCAGVPEALSWARIRDAAGAFNYEGGYAGKTDWRIPDVNELSSLVFCSSGYPQYWNTTKSPCGGEYRRPAILDAAFPNTPSTWFWTVSEDLQDPSSAWFVFFHYGSSTTGRRDNEKCLRLVRESGL